MASRSTSRTVVTGLAAALCVGAAVAAAVHFLRGPPRRFEPRAVPPETVGAIEAATQELLALARDARQARLREMLSPKAGPQALDALAAQLEAMAQAAHCSLAATDGYGPTLVKAIYDVTDAGGRRRQMALIFERRGGGVAVFDVAR